VSDLPHRLVEGHARRQPTSLAVRYRDERLTYADLEARANRLAHMLLARGVRPGDLVVTCLEPELDVPVVLLATLKAGGTYVPVDPTYPVARIQEMVADLAPRLVVMRRALARRLGVSLAAPLLALDDDARTIAAHHDTPPAVADDPERIATIFHTSGTTGKPKGARAAHRNVAWFAKAARERYAMVPTDLFPVIARFTFSISIFEVLVPLTAGATILILDRDHVMDAERMARTFEEVTFFHAGPSLLKRVLPAARAGWTPERYARVRHASSGGDMVPPQVLSDLRELFPRAEVFVIYGCSEISCMGCTDEVPRAGAIERTYVGLPFPGTEVRVLDESRQAVPAGEVGEVWFAGPGVITGYLARPELDAEKFVLLDGKRFYRTGDVGRFHPGRGVELLGRTDFQMKIRGMRVEAAEVEFHLRQVPGVADAACVGRESRGEKVLAAFIVRDAKGAPAGSVDAAELGSRVRRALSEKLPDYMVPAAIVEIAALPLNHNLKLDRHALPQLTDSAAAGGTPQALRTETERWFGRVWCELLKLPSVGRRQNFFELGGDSLLAMQVVARAGAELGVTIEGMDLLRETLAEVAAIADAMRAPTAVPVRATGVPAPDEWEDDGFRVDSFHFGPEASLYGILYRPTAAVQPQAVLICGPIASDQMRPNFVLNLLARRLAQRGIPTLRFDWFATADSLGEEVEGHPDRWRADLLVARAELARRSGTEAISAVGIGLGATLLGGTVVPRAWRRLVVWDPVLSGAAHIALLRRAHAAAVSTLLPNRTRRAQRVAGDVEELLGFTWSSSALAAVATLEMGPRHDRTGAALGWLATRDVDAQARAFSRMRADGEGSGFAALPLDAGWSEAALQLELMPDSGIVAAIEGLLA
jgi:amino acid adenylation domain-containing protein